MATEIPAQLKKDLPATMWGKVLGVTPVAMTVIATVLAGLASSEMNRAQYDRAMAAQLQSKASDQWNYFQAKKLRSAMQTDTADLLEASQGANGGAANSPAAPHFKTRSSLAEMTPDVRAAVQSFAEGHLDPEVQGKVELATPAHLQAALSLAMQRTQQFESELKGMPGASDPIGRRRFASARYDMESRLNGDVADVYEMLVRKSNQSAERHHSRSQLFFYGMLIGQMAVVISTFALAAKKHNVLWSLAAAAGAAALSFSIYVYLCI
jgi:hypothetical protein